MLIHTAPGNFIWSSNDLIKVPSYFCFRIFLEISSQPQIRHKVRPRAEPPVEEYDESEQILHNERARSPVWVVSKRAKLAPRRADVLQRREETASNRSETPPKRVEAAPKKEEAASMQIEAALKNYYDPIDVWANDEVHLEMRIFALRLKKMEPSFRQTVKIWLKNGKVCPYNPLLSFPFFSILLAF